MSFLGLIPHSFLVLDNILLSGHTTVYLSFNLLKDILAGVWVAQSIKCLTSAQVMISWFLSWSPTQGSLLTACEHRAHLNPLSSSLCPSPTCTLSKKEMARPEIKTVTFYSSYCPGEHRHTCFSLLIFA